MERVEVTQRASDRQAAPGGGNGVDHTPANEPRRVNNIEYRVNSLERGFEEMRADVKKHGTSLVAIETNLMHVKSTTDDLVKGLGGRVLLGAGGGAGLVTAVALALMELLKRA